MLLETNYSNIYVNSKSNSPSSSEKFRSAVVSALDQIWSAPSGRDLLQNIQNQNVEKKLTISKLESGDKPSTQAVLTRSQLERYSGTIHDFSDNLNKAAELSQTEGTSAIVHWSKDRSSVILHRDGVPKKIGKQSGDIVSTMAHELVHALYIMEGESMGQQGDRYDPSSPAGQEEFRAVGIDQFAYHLTGKPSENSIRSELGLPLRTQYAKR